MEPILNVMLFAGSLGLIEMLASANDRWTEQRRLSWPVRYELYLAACLAAPLLFLWNTRFGPL
jgi:hypothetical protein